MKKGIFALLLDTFVWAYICLSGYKVVYEKMYLNLRFPEFAWSQVGWCILVGFAIAGLLFLTPLSIGRASQGLMRRNEEESLTKQPFFLLGAFTVLLTFIVGIQVTKFSLAEFFSPAGVLGAKRIFLALLNPNWGILEIGLLKAVETIYMAFIATALAVPVAFTMSFFAARNLMNSSPLLLGIYSVTRFLMNISRSIEPLVWAIIFAVWVGIGPFSGLLALCIHSVASLAKLYSEQIEGIHDGPIEAMQATGANPVQVIWFGVVPQIVLPFLSFTIYRWDINVRMATVIGLVGGGGVGTLLMQYQGLAKWREVGMLVIIIAAIVWLMDWSSSRIREAIR